MKLAPFLLALAAAPALAAALTLAATPALAQTVRTEGGVLRGTTTADGLAVYKAIPFAAPPVGDLR